MILLIIVVIVVVMMSLTSKTTCTTTTTQTEKTYTEDSSTPTPTSTPKPTSKPAPKRTTTKSRDTYDFSFLENAVSVDGSVFTGKMAAEQNKRITKNYDWMGRMRRKYPVHTDENGKHWAVFTDVDGKKYSCPCSKEPTAEEYYDIGLIISDKRICKKYDR